MADLKTSNIGPSNQPKIPQGLELDEQHVYETLLRVRAGRILEKNAPPNVIVITDLGKDYDDLTAMVLLKELHRLGLIKLVGFIANLDPAQQRARFGRGALDSLDLKDIPIAWGEEASNKKRQVHSYEFDCDFMANNAVFTPYGQEKSNAPGVVEIESGVKLLDRLVSEKLAQEEKNNDSDKKLTFVLLSSLTDIAAYCIREPENLAKVTSDVVLQGGYYMERLESNQHILRPNEQAANNTFDLNSSTIFHNYMHTHKIPSVAYTKAAAFAASMDGSIFEALNNTGHVLGKHLYKIQTMQDKVFYAGACGPAEKRFKQFMDQEWYLKNKTTWYQKNPKGVPLPVDDEVLPYCNVVLYDALAALSSAGEDVLEELGVLNEFEEPWIHRVVGKKEKTVDDAVGDSGIVVEKMTCALRALLKGSLLACKQGISSVHSSGQ